VERVKITEYEWMDISKTNEVRRGMELRTPSPSNDNTCPPVLQLRDILLTAIREALACRKKINVKASWTAARYQLINNAGIQLDDSYKF
jgi:hypothetical protein